MALFYGELAASGSLGLSSSSSSHYPQRGVWNRCSKSRYTRQVKVWWNGATSWRLKTCEVVSAVLAGYVTAWAKVFLREKGGLIRISQLNVASKKALIFVPLLPRWAQEVWPEGRGGCDFERCWISNVTVSARASDGTPPAPEPSG